MITYLIALAFTLTVAHGVYWSKCRREKADKVIDARIEKLRRELESRGK